MSSFQALVLDKTPEFSAQVREVGDDFLPEGDVTVDVDYSTFNFKDGLAITNRSPVVRNWPMIAGIDGAGTVSASASAKWKPGDRVVLNGFGVGETHKGCLAGRARLKQMAQSWTEFSREVGKLIKPILAQQKEKGTK